MKVESASLDKLIAFWPLFAALGVGVAGYIKMSYRVDELEIKQVQRDKRFEEQRDKRNDEIESVRMRLTILETERQNCVGKLAN